MKKICSFLLVLSLFFLTSCSGIKQTYKTNDTLSIEEAKALFLKMHPEASKLYNKLMSPKDYLNYDKNTYYELNNNIILYLVTEYTNQNEFYNVFGKYFSLRYFYDVRDIFRPVAVDGRTVLHEINGKLYIDIGVTGGYFNEQIEEKIESLRVLIIEKNRIEFEVDAISYTLSDKGIPFVFVYELIRSEDEWLFSEFMKYLE